MEGSTRDEIKHTQDKFEMNIKTNIEMNIPVIGGGGGGTTTSTRWGADREARWGSGSGGQMGRRGSSAILGVGSRGSRIPHYGQGSKWPD